MNFKKIILIIVLIILLGIIGFLLIKVNEKSEEKIENIADNENNINSSKETVKVDYNDVIQITDNYFIQQTNDIYINSDEYVGKIVKIEGLIYTYEDSNGKTLYAVVRNTPGCCGNDGLAGIDIRYEGDYPKKDIWVEVTGVISKEKINGEDMPIINVSDIKETEKGITFVTN